MKQCKYCKTEINFYEWFFCGGECVSCFNEIKRRSEKKRKRDSKRYWDKQKK